MNRAVRRVWGGPCAAIGVLLAVWIVAALVSATPALAHAEVVTTSPAQGTRLHNGPAHLSITFSEEVSPGFSEIDVTDSAGHRVDVGKVRVASPSGDTLIVDLRPNLPRSGYLVEWTTLSDDSHSVTGSFSFAIGSAPMLDYAGAVTGDAYVEPALSLLMTIIRWLSFAGLIMMAGIGLVLAGWRAALGDRAVRRILLCGCGVSLFSAISAGLLEGPYATGRGVDSAFSAGLIEATLGTPYGRGLALRALAVLAFTILVWRVVASGVDPEERIRSRHETAGICLGLVLILSFAASGHAVDDNQAFFALLFTMAHLGAMAMWVGGLTVLFVGLRRRAVPQADAQFAVTRFSTMATWLVAVVACSGLYLSWHNVGSIANLWQTGYGRILSLKLGLVVILLYLGNRSRLWVQRRETRRAQIPEMRSDHSPEGLVGAVLVSREYQQTEVSDDYTGLRKRVRLELAIAAAVLAVTAVLVSERPARIGNNAETKLLVMLQGCSHDPAREFA